MKSTTKESVRDRVVETACELLYRQGFRATGINQIIRESGVAKASFYDHFKSKDDLLGAYVEEMARRELAEVRCEVMAFPTPRERFFGPLSILPPWFEATEYRGCPFQIAASEMPRNDQRVQRALRMHREQLRLLFHEITAALVVDTPELAGTDVALLADSYMLTFEGVVALTTVVRQPWPVERARGVVEQQLRGLTAA